MKTTHLITATVRSVFPRNAKAHDVLCDDSLTKFDWPYLPVSMADHILSANLRYVREDLNEDHSCIDCKREIEQLERAVEQLNYAVEEFDLTHIDLS